MSARPILVVVGTRPNLMKAAPILRALDRQRADGAPAPRPALVHTGQHYDPALSAELFADLRLPAADHQLGVGSGTHAAMTAEIIRRLEPVLVAERPALVVVVGDVNSTLAAALTAAKLELPVAHVEAGLRSGDRSMPEETNRIVTDLLATVLFTTEAAAGGNLRRENVPPERIHFVGNVMIDSLLWALPRADAATVGARLGLERGAPFALLTVHRAANLGAAPLGGILAAAAALARELPVVLPAHPRTRDRIAALGLSELTRAPGEAANGRILLTGPLGYLDFIHLLARARLVLTDSGGLQDETTAMGVPCLTLRDTTERPVTLAAGTSVLVGSDRDRILAHARAALAAGPPAERPRPPLWDGHAAERIAAVLSAFR